MDFYVGNVGDNMLLEEEVGGASSNTSSDDRYGFHTVDSRHNIYLSRLC